MNRASTALIGAFGVTAASNRATFKAAHKARRQGEDAKERADDAYSLAEGLAKNGDMQRLQADIVSDLLTGVAAASMSYSEKPSPFLSTPAVTPRMDLPEELAIAPARFPPAVNEYDADGRLVRPGEALYSGELVATGYALTHPSARAALLGLAHNGEQPSAAQLAQVHRFFAALEAALRAGISPFTPDGFTLDALTAAWTRFFVQTGATGKLPRGKIAGILEDTGSVSNSTTEGLYVSFTVPRTACDIGESVHLRAELFCASATSNNTLEGRVRLGGLGGQVVMSSGPVDPGNTGEGIPLDLVLQRRRNDESGNAVYAVSGMSRGSTTLVPYRTFSVPAGSDFVLSLTGQWGAAEAANVSTCSMALLEKL